MKLKANNNRRAGFSLAELMVVIVILGLLVSVVAPNVFQYLGQGQQARVRSDLIAISQAIDNFRIQNLQFPDSIEVLIDPDPDTGEPFLRKKSVPTDPWGNEYIFEPPSGGDDYRLYSMGEDGALGGEGKARDLTIDWAKGDEEE